MKAQSICDFFNSPLISDQIAGRCNYGWLPPVCMILANLDFYLFYTQRRDDHVGQLFGSSDLFSHWVVA